MATFSGEELTRHVPRMYRVALRLVGDSHAAQEIAQEAYARALRGIERFDGQSMLTTWFHRITTNCARDHLRQKRREPIDLATLDGSVAGMPAAPAPSPSADAETLELYRIAAGLVAQLPDDCRAAFVLTQLDGYSYDEAAAIENQPRGTMASRVYRAKRILRDRMTGPGDGRAVL